MMSGIGHQPRHESAGILWQIPYDDPGEERVRTRRVDLDGTGHHSFDDLACPLACALRSPP